MNIFDFLYRYNISLSKRINPDGKLIRGVKPIIKNTYFEYNFDNCLDFLDAFDINKSELYYEGQNEIFTDYIYRGHKCAEWSLIPSTFRKKDNETKEDFDSRINVYKQTNGALFNEINDFALFVKGIDNLGLNTTDDSYKLIKTINRNSNITGSSILSTFEANKFPEYNQLSELALAQHFGVKTRLLDFTENPLIAVFFASESAFPFEFLNKEKKEKIGVWVIPKLLIDVIEQEGSLQYVDVKKFQNNYISAQKGVFINYFPSIDDLIKKTRKTDELLDITLTLDSLLSKQFEIETLNKLINEHIGKPMLFTLPHNELPLIAKRLNQLNINWITLMPSLDGVKKEVERQSKKPFTDI